MESSQGISGEDLLSGLVFNQPSVPSRKISPVSSPTAIQIMQMLKQLQ
jgi:hypothetical protein